MPKLSGTITRTTPFLNSTVIIILILSTMFGLYKYYMQAQSMNPQIDYGLSDELTYDQGNASLVFVSFLIDILASINPFGFLKIFLVFILQPTPIIYDILNTFILNPVGLIVTFYELNWVISKIPTEASEV